jgi:hypothetical protein
MIGCSDASRQAWSIARRLPSLLGASRLPGSLLDVTAFLQSSLRRVVCERTATRTHLDFCGVQTLAARRKVKKVHPAACTYLLVGKKKVHPAACTLNKQSILPGSNLFVHPKTRQASKGTVGFRAATAIHKIPSTRRITGAAEYEQDEHVVCSTRVGGLPVKKLRRKR